MALDAAHAPRGLWTADIPVGSTGQPAALGARVAVPVLTLDL